MTAQQVWQQDIPERLDLTPEEIRRRLDRIRQLQKRGSLIGYVLVGLLVVLVALRADAGPGVTNGAIETVRLILNAGIVLSWDRIQQFVRAHARSQAPLSIAGQRAATHTIDAYRDHLQQRLDYLQSISKFYWPFYFTGLPLLAGLYRDQPALLLGAYFGLFVFALGKVVWQTRSERPWVRGEIARIGRIRILSQSAG